MFCTFITLSDWIGLQLNGLRLYVGLKGELHAVTWICVKLFEMKLIENSQSYPFAAN